jgi:hypothetical protein
MACAAKKVLMATVPACLALLGGCASVVPVATARVFNFDLTYGDDCASGDVCYEPESGVRSLLLRTGDARLEVPKQGGDIYWITWTSRQPFSIYFDHPRKRLGSAPNRQWEEASKVKRKKYVYRLRLDAGFEDDANESVEAKYSIRSGDYADDPKIIVDR